MGDCRCDVLTPATAVVVSPRLSHSLLDPWQALLPRENLEETGNVLLRVETPGGDEEEVSLPPCHLLADLEAELATNAKAVAQAPVADNEPFDAEVSTRNSARKLVA